MWFHDELVLYSFLYKYLYSTVIVLLSRIELLLYVCCCQVIILIKTYFNLLITGIQACGLSSIGKILQVSSIELYCEICSSFFEKSDLVLYG